MECVLLDVIYNGNHFYFETHEKVNHYGLIGVIKMIHGVKYFNSDIVYLKKSHLCPDCNTRLETVKVSKVVNSNSPEAKEFDFGLGRRPHKTWLVGNIKFVWKEFECPKCKRHITVKEMKSIEGIAETSKIASGKSGTIVFAILVVLYVLIWILAKKQV